jgi:hypothetical protein
MITLIISVLVMTFASNATELKNTAGAQKHPFAHDLGIKILPSTKKEAEVTVCCHGYGHSNMIGDVLNSFKVVPDHIISFNFPDYNCVTKRYDPKKSTFGSIDELLPFLYVLKVVVIDAQLQKVNLYGFSAGGGAVINALAVLNQNTYDAQLKTVGIDAAGKKKIVDAIQNGLIILDCPLKSIDEIIDLRGKDPEFVILSKRYIKNKMRPIDAIQKLQGMNLTVLLHFQSPDEILGNRDDKLFADRLMATNKGKTQVIYGNDGGHNSLHASLWNEYKKIKK